MLSDSLGTSASSGKCGSIHISTAQENTELSTIEAEGGTLVPCLDSVADSDQRESDQFVADVGNVDLPVRTSTELSAAKVASPSVVDSVDESGAKYDGTRDAEIEQLRAELAIERAAKSRLLARLQTLEERISGLQAENDALSDSLAIFTRLQADEGGEGAADAVDMVQSTDVMSPNTGASKKAWMGSAESGLESRVLALLRAHVGADVTLHSSTASDALMLLVLEGLCSLLHLQTSLAPSQMPPNEATSPYAGRDDLGGSGLDDCDHELTESLRHTFVGALQILGDLLRDPTGASSREFMEPHPVRWLLQRFPFHRVQREVPGAARGETVVVSAALMGGRGCWLPLHWCLAAALPETIDVEVLSEGSVGATAFTQHVSPLSVAVAKPIPCLDSIAVILRERPDALRKADADGSLPLMHACACNDGTEAIDMLYNAFPGAVMEQDSLGFRAINYAAYSGSTEVVQHLLNLHPRSATLVAGNGALALHDAVENYARGGLNMVNTVFLANTQAISHADDDGALPLHRAARAAGLEVVQFLHQTYPKAISTADKEGLLPMHYASQRSDKNLNLQVVQYILECNPSGRVGELTRYSEPADKINSPSIDRLVAAVSAFSLWASPPKSHTAEAVRRASGINL